MVQISRKKLPKELLSKLLLLFFEVVGKKNKNEEFEKIINDLFSETERIMVIKRVAIMYLLTKQIQPVVIADVLSVSLSTVAKFSIIMEKSEGIAPYLRKLLKKEKISDFFEDIFDELFNYPGRYGINWSQAWRSKIEKQNRRRTGV